MRYADVEVALWRLTEQSAAAQDNALENNQDQKRNQWSCWDKFSFI